MTTAPAWALANETIRYLMGAGLTLEEAFEKAERQALQWDAPDLPPVKGPRMCSDAHALRLACLAWDPASGPPPILMG